MPRVAFFRKGTRPMDQSAKRSRLWLFVAVTTLLVVGTAALSICIGARKIPFGTLVEALLHYDETNTSHVIVFSLRVPRTIVAVAVGASLAASGALMQAITRNPMASPSVLGINAGASLGLALAMALAPAASFSQTVMFSFAGAAVATIVIFGVASACRAGSSPVRLALVGTAISALFSAFSQAIAMFFKLSQDLTYWSAGGISGVRPEQVRLLLPWTLAGIVLALVMTRSVAILSLGEDVATGLGGKVGLIKLGASVAVLILTGSSVAIAGSISFVGLVTPHAVKAIVGSDYRKIVPCSMLAGACLMLLADICGRMVNPPFETPTSAITALIGVPFFIYLATRKETRV